MRAEEVTAGTAPAEPPERIVLRGMVLRRWAEGDLDASFEAVSASYEHLHPWLPWAARPPERSALAEFIRTSVENWRRGEAYAYGIFTAEEDAVLGAVGLHRRVGPGALEIGYWVHVDHTGQGIASTATAVVTDIAFALPGTERVEIHCDPANVASAAVPRRLGFRHDRTQRHTPDVPGSTGMEMIWIMPRASYRGSEAARRAHAAVGTADAR